MPEDRTHFPTRRYLPQSRLLKRIRKQPVDLLRQSGGATFGFGADGVEVDKPRLEERPRHLLQRRAHPPVQLDLVVQRAEEVGDGPLFSDRRNWELQRFSKVPFG